MVSFAALFAILSTLKIYGHGSQSRYIRFIPSGIAFAIGFLNLPSFTLARLVGGLIEYGYKKGMSKQNCSKDIRLIVIASGFVLGEGVMSIASLILRTFGVGVVTCWGCTPGLCGGC